MRLPFLTVGALLGQVLFSTNLASAATVYTYPTYTNTPIYTSAPTYVSPTTSTSSTDAIAYVESHGLMTGYSNDGFGAGNLVNRAEFAKIVTTIYSRVVPAQYTTRLPFSDTSNTAWYTPFIVYVYGNGLMGGYADNTFRPSDPVTFAEATKTLSLAYRLNVTDGDTPWYLSYVQKFSDLNAIPLSITSVNQPLTRGVLADILERLDANDRSQPSRSASDIEQVNSDINTSFYNGTTNATGACSSASRNLIATIDAEPKQPNAGDTVTYNIAVLNCSGYGQTVDVTASLDAQVTFVSASNNGTYGGNQVFWNNLPVQSGSSNAVVLSVRVSGTTIGTNSIDLSVHAVGSSGNQDTESSSLTVASVNNANCYYDSYGRYVCGSGGNCYYDATGNYRCDGNTYQNCYYDSTGRYLCPNSNSNSTSNSCYYSSTGQYICGNNSCYYDSYGNYTCNNTTNNNCSYNSAGQYTCNNSVNTNNNTCSYNSSGVYTCNNSSNNNCYYNASGVYTCNNNTYNSNNSHYRNRYTNSGNCYYDSSRHYICPNTSGSSCYYDNYGNYTCGGSVNGNCYTNAYGTLTCDNNSTSNSCYYDSNGHYTCNNSTNSNNNCSYDSTGRYICRSY